MPAIGASRHESELYHLTRDVLLPMSASTAVSPPLGQPLPPGGPPGLELAR